VLGALLRAIGFVTDYVIKLDGTTYAWIGESFAKGDFAQGLRGVFPPVFPILIGLFHSAIPDIELAGRLVSYIFGVLIICVCFIFTKRFLDEKQALWSSFFVAIHPYLVKSSSEVLTESVATFLFLMAIFLFYKGWLEDRGTDVALSGIMLGLTYLTRPEYIVFFVPMSLLLLWKKRFVHTIIFICCFFPLVISYIYYMKLETGFFVVSKKAILAKTQPAGSSHHSYLMPFLPFALVIKYIPYVALNFIKAQFIPFFVLAIVGFRAMNKRYRILVLSLIAVHILSIATISHSTERFSIEFVPLTLPFAAMGLGIFSNFMQNYKNGRLLYISVLAIIILSSLILGYSAQNRGRMLQKQAGLFLREIDPGKVIASRLPIVPFYSRGTWIVLPIRGDCSKFIDTARNNKAKYFILDDVLEEEIKWSKECRKILQPFNEIRLGHDFVTINRLKDE
jgi:4-amino-4-deoxy-L-arabinose transferase-like glycosyltransferase